MRAFVTVVATVIIAGAVVCVSVCVPVSSYEIESF